MATRHNVHSPRNVVHQEGFLADGKAIFGTMQRLDEFLSAFDLTLARAPTRARSTARALMCHKSTLRIVTCDTTVFACAP